MAVYDDEKQASDNKSADPADDELRRLTGNNQEQEEAHDRETTRGATEDIAEREGLGKNDDSPDDTVGRGFQQGSNRKKRRGKMSSTKKKASAIITASIISLIVAIFSFFSLVPLKVVSTMTNVNNIYQSTQRAAIQKAGHKLFSDYVVNDVLAALNKKNCKSTIDPSCVVTPSGTGPIGRLHKAWADARIERKLAQQGLIVGKKGPNYYMKVGGTDVDLTKDLGSIRRGEKTLFDLDGTNKTNTREIRRQMREIFKKGTLWEKTYVRFKVGRYLVRNLNLTRCLGFWGCSPESKRSNTKESLEAKKVAAKAFIAGKVITPISASGATVVLCIIGGGDGCNAKDLEDAKEGDNDRQTRLHSELNQAMAAVAAKAGVDSVEKLKKLSSDADSIAKKGLSVHMGDKISAKLSSEAAKTGVKVSAKSIPVVGWILTAVRLLHTATEIGPLLKYAGYAVNAQAAASLYHVYNTDSEQIKSGNDEAAAVGSFSDTLSSSTIPEQGSKYNEVDMTASPLYSRLMNTSNSSKTTVFSDVLGTTAYAAGNSQAYTCDGEGHSAVPAGELVCPEENFTGGIKFASKLSAGVTKGLKAVNLYGPIELISKAIDTVFSALGGLLGPLLNKANEACHNFFVNKITKCGDVVNKVQQKFGDFVGFLADKVLPTPFSADMSGARTFDLIAAGADVTSNGACKNVLGCKRVSDEEAAAIRSEQLAQQEEDFKSRSLLARLFDTSTPYSLTSRVALSMPSSMTTAGNNLASMLANSPFTAFSGLFGSMFRSDFAFAGIAPAKSPFGVVQYAVPNNALPDNPQEYWDNNCAEDYDIITSELDRSDWLNNNDNVGFDETTGESYFKRVDKCRLILTSIQSVGSAFDQSLLPDEEKNSDTGNTILLGGDSTSGASKDGWSWPVSKSNYVRLSSCYAKPGHTGIDIPASAGTPVLAARDGQVIKTDPSGSSDGGKYIIIKHGDGHWTNYQHNNEILVHPGEKVVAGQVIAKSGSTGYSTGAHIHFSVTTQEGLDSRSTVAYSVNPLSFLPSVSGRDLGGCK